MTSYRVRDVFVAGGQPSLTYVSRDHLQLEQKLQNYLDKLHSVLSISGPTKSGKTVLVKKILPKGSALWVSGGQLKNADDFWKTINEEFGNYQAISEKDVASETHLEARDLDAAMRPGGMGGGIKSTVSDSKNKAAETLKTWAVDAKRSALRSLQSHNIPLVIDDFHYLDSPTQTVIIRSLKDPVFEGLPVILLSVPHRAFDAVKMEREMTGR